MTVSLEATFREEWPRAVAILTRVLGDLSLAEDAVQDAFATARGHSSRKVASSETVTSPR